METTIVFVIIIGLPAMWVATHLMVAGTPYYKWFLIVNTLILLAGLYIMSTFTKKIFGHDEYGLAQLFGYIFLIIFQIIISFALALYLKIKDRTKTIN